jgi:putative ABC transport system permease protein
MPGFSLPLALRLAARELRGGTRGLRIVLACLALGVAIVAAVGTLRVGLERGLAADGSRLLGGDIEIESGTQPLPAALRDFLAARGARLSDVVSMRSMLVAPSGERQLVELRAVDTAWPLVGSAAFAPAQSEPAALAGVVADQVVLDRLGLHPGDTVRLGEASLTLTGAIEAEPDRVTGTAIAPRAIIAAATLPRTGLMAPGAMVNYALRAVLGQADSAPAAIAAIRAAFPNTGWRIRDSAHAAPGIDRFVEQTGQFLTLVGLTALLVGGIGVANGVRAWLEARARTIATLRCLGASAGLILSMALIQVMALACLGTAIGLLAGAALPIALVAVAGDLLPIPARLGLYPGPLLTAAAYGLLTAATFALWPVGRAVRIPGAALFREAVLPTGGRASAALIAANLILAAALVLLTLLAAPDWRFAAGFCAGAAAALGVFRLGAFALARLARLGARLGSPVARLGLANLHRPGAATPLMLVSVGLGLSTLAAVTLIQGNLRAQVLERMPDAAPSLFFVDIQNDQLARFDAIAAATPGVISVRHVPNLRARVVSVNGTPAERVAATPETQWALRGDRGLTYAATPPAGSTVVAGQWWPADYAGPPLMSFDDGLAAGWGVHVGDTIRVNVLGRDIDLKVANLRHIAWQSLGINFTMVASPGLLSSAPHTHLATARTTPAGEAALLRAVTDALPNVTGIPVAEVLRAVADLLDRIAWALGATGSLALVAGALVLAGAVAAGQRRRTREAVILKALGAARAQIRAAWMVEFGALGLAAGLLAAGVGTAASWAVMHTVMHADWTFLPGHLAVTIAACMALMLGFGYAGTAAALRSAAMPFLRNE